MSIRDIKHTGRVAMNIISGKRFAMKDTSEKSTPEKDFPDIDTLAHRQSFL